MTEKSSVLCHYPKCKKKATHTLSLADPDSELEYYCEEHCDIVKMNTIMTLGRKFEPAENNSHPLQRDGSKTGGKMDSKESRLTPSGSAINVEAIFRNWQNNYYGTKMPHLTELKNKIVEAIRLTAIEQRKKDVEEFDKVLEDYFGKGWAKVKTNGDKRCQPIVNIVRIK